MGSDGHNMVISWTTIMWTYEPMFTMRISFAIICKMVNSTDNYIKIKPQHG